MSLREIIGCVMLGLPLLAFLAYVCWPGLAVLVYVCVAFWLMLFGEGR